MKLTLEWSPSEEEVAEALWSFTSDRQARVFSLLAAKQQAVREADKARGFVVGVPVNQWFELGRSIERSGDFDAVCFAKDIVDGMDFEKERDA